MIKWLTIFFLLIPTLAIPAEEVERGYNYKKFQEGRTIKYEFHGEDIHYKDGDDFLEVDLSLKPDFIGNWKMDQASYNIIIPEYSDQFFTFINKYKGKAETIKAKPIASHVKGIKEGNKIVYPDAFDVGVDLIAEPTRTGILKTVRFNVPQDDDYEIVFVLDISNNIEIKKEKSVKWDKNSNLEFKDKTVNVGRSFFKKAKVWDSGGKREEKKQTKKKVDIEMYKKAGKLYLKKTIPNEFFVGATYPIYTDHPTDYNPGAGDGSIYSTDTSWSAARDAATGDGNDDTSTVGSVYSRVKSTGSVAIQRGFFPIDTSAITDTDTITAAIFKVFSDTDEDGTEDEDAQAYITVVQTSQASASSLENTDFDAVTFTKGTDTDLDLSAEYSGNDWEQWTLNSTGRGWINKTGTTYLGLVEGHDFEDVPIVYQDGSGTYTYNYFGMHFSEHASNNPTLDVTTTPAAGGGGTAYYVKNGGSDSADGLSDGNAWETISKIQSSSFSAGDVIYFNKGDTWAEDLSFPSSGTLGNEITLTAYGSGADPIMQRLRFYAAKSHIRVTGIQMTAVGGAAIIFEGSENIIVDDCIVDGNSSPTNHSVVVGGDAGNGWSEDITIKNSTLYNAGTLTGAVCNISIHKYARDILIENNTVYGSSDNNIQATNASPGVDTAYAPYNITIRENTVYGCTLAHGIEIGWDVHDAVVERNFSYGNAEYGIMAIISDDVTIKNNIIYDNSVGILLGENTNKLIYNNTLINNTIGIKITSNSGTGNVIKNNIIYGATNHILSDPGVSAFESNYNIIYETSDLSLTWQGTEYTTLASWRTATSQDANSVNSDPLFSDAGGANYTLQTNSPGIDTGVTLAGVTVDAVSVTRPQGSAYDIGAYEKAFAPTSSCDGAVICWTLEEGTGITTEDKSPQNNDGTFSAAGSPAWGNSSLPDNYTWYVDGDGDADWILGLDDADLNFVTNDEDFTCYMLMNQAGDSGYKRYALKQETAGVGWQLVLANTSGLGLIIDEGATQRNVSEGSGNLSDSWHHVFWQFDNSENQWRLYVDKAVMQDWENMSTTGGYSHASGYEVAIMGRDNNASTATTGKVAAFACWDSLKTTAEMDTISDNGIYSEGVPGSETTDDSYNYQVIITD